MREEALLASRLSMSLMRLGTRIASGFDTHFHTLGLTQAQFRLLLTLWEEGGDTGLSPGSLADRLLIERPSVSTLVTTLVHRGWIERRPGQNRRTHQLVLTPTGSNVLQRAIPSAVTIADYIFSNLDAPELPQLRSLLDSIEQRLRDFAPPATPEVLP